MLIDRNTIDVEGSTLVNVYGGPVSAPRAVLGFTMRNNATRHGSYGMGGSHFTYGNDILANYYPGSTFTANYLAGGPSSRYPAGNLFQGVFTDQFANPAAGDFTLRIPVRGPITVRARTAARATTRMRGRRRHSARASTRRRASRTGALSPWRAVSS